MTPKPRTIRLEFNEHSLVPLEQLDAQGHQIAKVTLVDPETGNILTLYVPKLHCRCPQCGQPKPQGCTP
jgi:hypothetical protein